MRKLGLVLVALGAGCSGGGNTASDDGATAGVRIFRSVVGGMTKICGVVVDAGRTSGSIVCAGMSSSLPIDVPSGSDFVEVAISGDTVCGLTASGTVSCRDMGATDGGSALTPPDPGPGGHLIGGDVYMCSHGPSGYPVCKSMNCAGTCSDLLPTNEPGYSKVFLGTTNACGLVAGSVGGGRRLVCSYSAGTKVSVYTEAADKVESDVVAIEGVDTSSATICWLDSAGHPHCGGRTPPSADVQALALKKLASGRGFMVGLTTDGAVVTWGGTLVCGGGTLAVPSWKSNDVVVAGGGMVGACGICADDADGNYKCLLAGFSPNPSTMTLSLP